MDHSVHMFHKSVIDRSKADPSSQMSEDLAARGKKRNQLASMAAVHADHSMLSSHYATVSAAGAHAASSASESNRDAFRAKKQRYGW